jgi:cytochrome b561
MANCRVVIQMQAEQYTFPNWARLLHAGMAIFGIAAYLTAELAEDTASTSTGYLLHAYLGLSLLAVILIRTLTGMTAGGVMNFKGWFPFSREQFWLAVEDIRNLVQMRIPERSVHQGLAALVQSAGLIIFLWMGVTGAGLFVLNGSESELAEALEELHEVGEDLIPIYLFLHIGAVVLHTLAGKPVWQKMWKFGK